MNDKHGRAEHSRMTWVSRCALTATCAALCGCGADSPRYQGVSPYFSKQFQALQFSLERPKDKYETTAQYEAWCAKRVKDNAELIAGRARQLAGVRFVSAVSATVGEYDADAGCWKVNAIVQQGSVQAESPGTEAKQSARTPDDRYWCDIVLGDVSAETQKNQGQITLLVEKTAGNNPSRIQSLLALIAADPAKAKAMAADIPEKQPCELWLYIEVLGVDVVGDKATQPAGRSYTPSESSLVCTPKLRIARVELRRKDGHRSHVWDFAPSAQKGNS